MRLCSLGLACPSSPSSSTAGAVDGPPRMPLWRHVGGKSCYKAGQCGRQKARGVQLFAGLGTIKQREQTCRPSVIGPPWLWAPMREDVGNRAPLLRSRAVPVIKLYASQRKSLRQRWTAARNSPPPDPSVPSDARVPKTPVLGQHMAVHHRLLLTP